jgi:hypothetical protein
MSVKQNVIVLIVLGAVAMFLGVLAFVIAY